MTRRIRPARRSRAHPPPRERVSGLGGLDLVGGRFLGTLLILFGFFGFPTRSLLLLVRHDSLPPGLRRQLCRGCSPMQTPNQARGYSRKSSKNSFTRAKKPSLSG